MDCINEITQEIANTLGPLAGILNNIVQDELRLERRREQEIQKRNNQLTTHLTMCFLAYVNFLDRNEIIFSVLRFHSRKLLRSLESSRLNRRFANPEREEMPEIASGVEQEVASGVVSQVLADIVSKVVSEVENIPEVNRCFYDELD